MIGPKAVPRALDFSDGELLKVAWSDGGESVFEQKALRRACPCAVCREQRLKLGPDRFVPASVMQAMRIERTAPVGRYGVKIFWSDGHNTGIYTFEMLREWAEGPEGKPIH